VPQAVPGYLFGGPDLTIGTMSSRVARQIRQVPWTPHFVRLRSSSASVADRPLK
jgi:hypothetical protein